MEEGRETTEEELNEVISEVEPETEPEIELGEAGPHETTEETAIRVAKALEEGKEPTEGAEASGSEAESEEAAKPKEESEPEVAEAIEPPSRFTAAAKEAWANVPKEVQVEYSKAVKDLEAQHTKKAWELGQREQEANTVLQSIQPWVKEWAAREISPGTAIAQVLKDHEALQSDNTGDVYLELGQKLGHDLEGIARRILGIDSNGELPQQPQGDPTKIDISQHPEFVELRNQFNALQNESMQRAGETVAAEIRELRDEKEADGRFKYPKLHDRDFLQRAKPFVAGLRESFPDLTWSQAFKVAMLQDGNPNLTELQAISQVLTESNGNFSKAAPTEFQPSNSQHKPQARPVSVRPTTSPSAKGSLDIDPEELKGLSVEQTAELVANKLIGGA